MSEHPLEPLRHITSDLSLADRLRRINPVVVVQTPGFLSRGLPAVTHRQIPWPEVCAVVEEVERTNYSSHMGVLAALARRLDEEGIR